MKRLTMLRPARGFTLVELMVSIVIGLLAILFATRMMTDSERTKDGALGGSQSMQNGMMAMFSISGDVEQAGFGLNDPLLVGCDTIFYDRLNFELTQVKRGAANVRPLAPVVIVNGGSGPDQVSLYAGTAASGTATMRLVTNYSGGNQVEVDRKPYAFTDGDVVVFAPENSGGKCALAQLSGISEEGTPTLSFGDTDYRYNRGELGENYPGSATRVFNLGRGDSLAFHTWLVEDNVLRLRATNLGNTDGAAQAVADNIVSLKAQYGFDKRAGTAFDPEQGMQISEWSNTMIDADGDGVTGGAGDYQRVAAVRLAVVARNRAPERPAPGGACSATTEAVKVFTSKQPSNVTAVPVTLDLSTPAAEGGDEGGAGEGADAAAPVDWTCYRYRAFETIIPLRNAGWRPDA